MAKARKTAAQAADKFASRVAQSGPAYQSGVTNPNVDWVGGATSTEAIARRDAGLQAAIAGHWIEDGVRRAGNNKWRAGAAGKGVAAWPTATQNAKGTYQAAMSEVEGDYSGAEAAMNSVGPGSTRAQRIARAAAWDNYMGEAADKRKSTR